MQGGRETFLEKVSLPPLHPPILSKNFYLEGWQWREGRRTGRWLSVSIRQDRICMKGRDRIAASGQRSPEKNFGCSPYCLSALSRHKKRERPKTFSFFVRAGRDDGFP